MRLLDETPVVWVIVAALRRKLGVDAHPMQLALDASMLDGSKMTGLVESTHRDAHVVGVIVLEAQRRSTMLTEAPRCERTGASYARFTRPGD
jgi:hypothetical protein